MNNPEVQKCLMQGYAACSFIAVTAANVKEVLEEIIEFEQELTQVADIKQPNFFATCRSASDLLTELQRHAELLHKAIMEKANTPDKSNEHHEQRTSHQPME